MDIIGRPQRHHDFNGKILMRRLSKRRYISSITAHANFTDDAVLNTQIKEGEWRHLIDVTIKTGDDLMFFFANIYELENEVVDRLEFFYCVNVGSKGKTKYILILQETDISMLKIQTEDEKELPPPPK